MAKNNKGKSENLVPFQKGFDPRRNLNGGPRKLIAQIAGLGYSYGEISATILNICALSIEEIQKIVDNPTSSALERMICKALLRDFEKGSLWNLETIISRAIGKPKETQAVSTDNKIEVVFVKGKTIL